MRPSAQCTTDELLAELSAFSRDGYVLLTRGNPEAAVAQYRVFFRRKNEQFHARSNHSWRTALEKAVDKKRSLQGFPNAAPPPAPVAA